MRIGILGAVALAAALLSLLILYTASSGRRAAESAARQSTSTAAVAPAAPVDSGSNPGASRVPTEVTPEPASELEAVTESLPVETERLPPLQPSEGDRHQGRPEPLEASRTTQPVEPLDERPEGERADPNRGESEHAEPEAEPQWRTLSGWVFNQSGEPVPDLQVVASARRLAPASREIALAGGGREQSTRTNGNGFFGFGQLLDGEYQVRTESTERYEAASAMLRAGVDSAVLVVTDKEGRQIWVHGLVDSARGGPLGGVRVLPIGQPQRAATSDEWGGYGLHLVVGAGRQEPTLRFLRTGYREKRVTLARAELAGVEQIELDASLEPIEEEELVTGIVLGMDGLPVALARVELTSPALARRYQALSDDAGQFHFPQVELAADYRLWVRPRGRYKDHVEEDLWVGPGGLDLTIVLEPLELASLRGQMVDPDGRAVSGFTLWLRSAFEGAEPFIPVTGDRQGRFLVEELPEGPLTLQTLAAPFFSFSGIELSADVSREVRLTLDTGTQTFDGFVEDTAGGPVAGASVALFWSLDAGGVRSRASRQTVTDAQGYFLFTQLGSGLHTASVSAAGFRGARVEHDVSANDSELVIRLQEISP